MPAFHIDNANYPGVTLWYSKLTKNNSIAWLTQHMVYVGTQSLSEFILLPISHSGCLIERKISIATIISSFPLMIKDLVDQEA